jgi:hypothetical protein
MFFQLASVLLSRFLGHGQLEDIKYSLTYFRFLRINFHRHSLEVFNIPRDELTSRLLEALSLSLAWGSGDTIQEMEEMVALVPEVLALDVSKASRSAIKSFIDAVAKTEMFRLKHTQQVAERVIQIIREATVHKPDSYNVSYALASCLADRFQSNHVITDYEEAIAIAEKIVAAHSPGHSLTSTQALSIMLILRLLVSRLNSSPRPEYLEDAIHRIQTLLRLPSLLDNERTQLTFILNNYVQLRFSYFGVSGNSGEAPPNPLDVGPAFIVLGPALRQWGVGPLQMPESFFHLRDILILIKNGKITDVEGAVELSRTYLPSKQSSDQFLSADMFAAVLFFAHRHTNRLEYLNEAITAYRDLRGASAPKAIHFEAGCGLLVSVIARWNVLGLWQELKEAMSLFPELGNDGSGEVSVRFKISYRWSCKARDYAHPSTSTAYETAMSLMHETLVFSPTLQTQHFHLTDALMEMGGLPLDYASYCHGSANRCHRKSDRTETGRSVM